jgi:hypothetical protein
MKPVLSLLMGFLWCSLAQMDGLRPAYPKSQWRVRNLEPVPKFWALLELEFHLATTCDEPYAEAPISSGFISISTSGAHPPSLVFDGVAQNDIGTAWWPQCDPCGAGEAWVGQDFTMIWPDIMCIRVYQHPDPDYHSSAISLQVWNGTAWIEEMPFEGLYGGYFQNLPVVPLTLWRVTALEDAPSGWAVAELGFFRDIECYKELLQGVPGAYGFIGNGSVASDLANPPTRVYDGNETTHWMAPCSSGGCLALVPWLALNLHSPGTVRCIKLLQCQNVGVQSVIVQSWNKNSYDNRTIFTALATGVWDHLYRWEDCQHVARTLWRFLPNETVAGQWTVIELEIHRNTNCSELMPTGIVIASGALNGTALADAGFDGNATSSYPAAFDSNLTSFFRAPSSSTEASGLNWPGWQAGNQTQGNETIQTLGFPWFGISVPQEVQGPQCLKLLQSNVLADASSSLVVQTWNGSAWEDYSDFITEAGGSASLWYDGLTDIFTSSAEPTWIRLPALDRTQYRLRSQEVLWEHWAVKEIYFWESIGCSVEVAGTPIAAAQDPATVEHSASNAFDRQLSTEWWSTCNEPCRAQEAWLGVALAGPRNLRCISLLQSSQPPRDRPVPWWTVKASIEKWNGHRWVHVADASGLGHGAWDSMYVYSQLNLYGDAVSGIPYYDTDADTLWRLLSIDPVPQRWTLPSVQFYHDLDCNKSIWDAVPIASGYVMGADMSHAFDDSIESSWISSCERCNARYAWIGQKQPVPRWVRCVRIYQSITVPRSSSNIAVERWGGNSWLEAEILSNAILGTWEFINMPNPNWLIDDDSRVRWRVANAMPTINNWRIGSLKFFKYPNCTQQLQGRLISSGHSDGLGPAKGFDGRIDTFWESSCVGCDVQQAWLGLSLEQGSSAVRCVQSWQQVETAWGVTEVAIQAQSGTPWIDLAQFRDLNYGSWNHMHLLIVPSLSMWPSPPPVLADTMWRIVNTEELERSWEIMHLRLFRRAELGNCSGEILGGPIASGQALGAAPSLALSESPFDTPAETIQLISGATNTNVTVAWRAPCVRCPVGDAWLGLSLVEAAEVQCLEFEQSSDSRDSTASMALERWDGKNWQVAANFKGLSSGAPMRLEASWSNPARLQRFRIVNLTPIHGQWRINELKFYVDLECTVEIRGIPFSSGSSGTNIPGLAFDDDLSTGWLSSHVQAMPYNASLGLHFDSPQDIKCVALRQSDVAGQWALGVVIETSTVDGWQWVQELQPLSEGAWFLISTFRSYAQDVSVNFQDEDTEVPPGYVGDWGEFYGDRADGLRYGWNCYLVGVKRTRFSDIVFDTIVELTCPLAIWEINVLRGRYYVMISYSNPGIGGKTSGCYIEGRSGASGDIPELEGITRKIRIDVADGELTFQGAADKECTSIAALDISPLPESYAMWRIVNGGEVKGRWRIQEVELHGTTNCGLNIFDLRQKSIIAPGFLEGEPPEYAIDADLATAWSSPCNGCSPGQAWIAAVFTSFQM